MVNFVRRSHNASRLCNRADDRQTKACLAKDGHREHGRGARPLPRPKRLWPIQKSFELRGDQPESAVCPRTWIGIEYQNESAICVVLPMIELRYDRIQCLASNIRPGNLVDRCTQGIADAPA